MVFRSGSDIPIGNELRPGDAERAAWFTRLRTETVLEGGRAYRLADVFARREGWGERFIKRASPEAAAALQQLDEILTLKDAIDAARLFPIVLSVMIKPPGEE